MQRRVKSEKGSGLEISVFSFALPRLINQFADRCVMQAEMGADLGQGVAVPQMGRPDRAVALRLAMARCSGPMLGSDHAKPRYLQVIPPNKGCFLALDGHFHLQNEADKSFLVRAAQTFRPPH